MIPGSNNIRKFRTEEELINYYEMKAIDAYENISPLKDEFDESDINGENNNFKRRK
jgi:hypothetical protein